jgi:iron complex outermembrane receptor protein
VLEGFGEAIVPILQDRPFFHMLSLRGAVRVSDYSTVGTTYSYNYGGEWAPIQDVKFRVIQARSVRAPNISELFSPPQQDFPSGLNDPCRGVTATSVGTLDTNCRAAPGVAANIAANGAFTVSQEDAQGITSFGGGNPALQEEKSDSFTAGVVINPRSISALRNLVFTADYFNIRIKDAIASTPLTFILSQCYNGINTALCDNIVRRATPQGANSVGSLDEVNTSPLNSGGIKTSGIDTTLAYRQGVLGGNAAVRVSYTHLFSGYNVPQPDSDRDYFANEVGASKDRFTTNLSYDIAGVGMTMTGTYIGAAYLDDQLVLANYPDMSRHDPMFKVGSQFYLDSQIRFSTKSGYEFYIGADNLLDNKPPYLADIGASAGQDTDTGTYDALGRRFYVGARIKL